MNVKKVMSMLGMMMLISVLLIGCSNGGSSSSSGSGGEAGSADDYPNKPIQIVVPAGAGGDTDLNTRITAKYLEKELGGKLVVSNVSGAGGTVGAKQVMDSNPDGYTVLTYHNSMIINSLLGLSDFNYEDYKHAGMAISDLTNSFIVSAKSDYKDLNALIKAAKEKPGEITIATETGAFTHLQLLAFQEAAGVELNIVDVGGAADKIKALLAGQVDVVPTQLGLVQQYIESGDFRSLGVMAEERLDGAPDVQTFKEQGVDITFDKFFFWAFPKDTPQDIVDQFSAALEKVANNPDFQKEIGASFLNAEFKNPEEAMSHFETLTEKYKTLHENSQ
jgi:tripartite-type tricarboxylate transporter receptor subunit TctC